MTDTARAIRLGWTDREVALGSHICCYYPDDAVLRSTLGFVRVGLDVADECCIIFADASRFDDLVSMLQEGYAGDVPALIESRKLVLCPGAPSVPELVSAIVPRLDGALADGYRVIRFLGFIAWGQPGWPGDRELLEFEARVNDVVAAYPIVVVCTYGMPALTGEQLIRGGLQTHPTVVIGDTVVQKSGFYISPEEFIATLGSGG